MQKLALVTGGSGGLGSAICHELANKGYKIIFTYNSKKKLALNVLSQLHGCGHKAYKINLSNSEEIENLFSKIKRSNKKLDLLVNCAGVTKFIEHSDLDSLTDELFDNIFIINVRSVFSMIKVFKPLLNNAKGCIVNITSLASQTAIGSNIAYCASKSAVENMTRSLARTLAPNIRVVAVAPGLIDTPFITNLDKTWRDRQEQATPLKRLANDIEIAQAVYVASDLLTFSTGTTIQVDGGRALGI